MDKDSEAPVVAVEVEDTWANEKIEKLLNDNNIAFTKLIHRPSRTSEESAVIRGVPLASGSKAMLIKNEKTGEFVLAVMSAAKKLSWKLMKPILDSKKASMAAEEDVRRITRCLPGAVPPFGSIFGIRTYCDSSLFTQGETINYNGGLRTHSYGMKGEEYKKIENPTVCDFTE